jgi:predicted DNA-binding transcriptional regulator AlpA
MEWLKVDAARAYAGGVSRKTLYAAVQRGELKAARIGAGRNLVFCEPWIDEWLSRCAQPYGAKTGKVVAIDREERNGAA